MNLYAFTDINVSFGTVLGHKEGRAIATVTDLNVPLRNRSQVAIEPILVPVMNQLWCVVNE